MAGKEVIEGAKQAKKTKDTIDDLKRDKEDIERGVTVLRNFFNGKTADEETLGNLVEGGRIVVRRTVPSILADSADQALSNLQGSLNNISSNMASVYIDKRDAIIDGSNASTVNEEARKKDGANVKNNKQDTNKGRYNGSFMATEGTYTVYLDNKPSFTLKYKNIPFPINGDYKNLELVTFLRLYPYGWENYNSFTIDPKIKAGWDDLYRYAAIRQYDPLTLDLDGNGIETLASNGHKGALFDHSNDGIRTATGWISKDDGLLVYDRNGDGVVNNGGELFGDNTFLKNGERAANGYQALADLDENGDGKVDAADSAFAKLRVWRDLNQDGISQEGELLTLDEAKVKALNLANQNADRDLGNGNSLAEEGTYTDSDGNEKQMGDLNLAADHFHSRFSDSVPLTDEQQQAPNLRGSGRVRDLREAAARSPELAEALQQYKNAATKEEQLTLRHENTAMTPGKPCHEYAEKDRLKALQGCNKSVQFPQNTTQTPHNNTWICRNNQHSRTSHDKPTDQYRPQAAASCSVSCLWYCPTLGLQ